jgi:hypothetical protein
MDRTPQMGADGLDLKHQQRRDRQLVPLHGEKAQARLELKG